MKTVVGLFDSLREAQSATRDLITAGYSREDMGLLASDPPGNGLATRPLLLTVVPGCRLSKGLPQPPRRSVEGRARWSVAWAGCSWASPSSQFPGSAGWPPPALWLLLSSAPAWGAAAGGLFAEVEKLGVPKERSGYYAEAVRRGGTLVFLPLATEQVDEAMVIMERHHAVNIEERADEWRRNPLSD